MHAEGARSFQHSGDSYDRFMGRYSRRLAAPFADWVGVPRAGEGPQPPPVALDVGCGPGALTAELVARLGVARVLACDPSVPFLDSCITRHPGIDARLGRAEELPFNDDLADFGLAQLVFHFVSEPEHAAAELLRVVRPGGVIAACTWDFAGGMRMLRTFWDAALRVDPRAPDEGALRFGAPGEFPALFEQAGLVDVAETTLEVSATYRDFDELWQCFLLGVGPAGSYLVSLEAGQQHAIRAELFDVLGSPPGELTLTAMARAGRGRVPAG